jgi:predicted aspartyl protease
MATRRMIVGGLGATLMSGILPAPRSAANEFTSKQQRMPFVFWHEDTILVPVSVNGVRTVAILDSAAAVSVVDQRFAATAKIETSSVSQALAGPGGKFRASRSGPFQVSIGNLATALPWAAIVDLSQASLAMGWPVGFLLGQDMLRRHLFDFHFDTNQFIVSPNGTALDTSALVELALARGIRQEPTIEIEVEGNAPITAAVDTGNSSPLLLSAAYADEMGVSSRRSSTSLSATANGLSTNRLITVNRVGIGHLEVSSVPTEIYTAWTSNGSPANIGMPLLAGRRLVFDFGQDRLWRSPSTTVPLRRDRSGLGIAVKPDRLVVVHVASGSPALAAGWRQNEEIVEIDGKQVGPTYNKGDLWSWRFRPAGRVVDLKLSDGAVRHLRLGDYY